jgi:carboxymethylenebutenolidase
LSSAISSAGSISAWRGRPPTWLRIAPGIQSGDGTQSLQRGSEWAHLPGSNGKRAVVEFCIGGLLTLKYAARFHCDAAVSFYGVRVHEHQKELRSIECPLQYHVGEADTHIFRDRINAIENVVNGMPNATLYTYQGAKHGFFNSLREEAFSREAFLAADQRMLELLTERL